jgi:hypothetical protein
MTSHALCAEFFFGKSQTSTTCSRTVGTLTSSVQYVPMDCPDYRIQEKINIALCTTVKWGNIRGGVNKLFGNDVVCRMTVYRDKDNLYIDDRTKCSTHTRFSLIIYRFFKNQQYVFEFTQNIDNKPQTFKFPGNDSRFKEKRKRIPSPSQRPRKKKKTVVFKEDSIVACIANKKPILDSIHPSRRNQIKECPKFDVGDLESLISALSPMETPNNFSSLDNLLKCAQDF